MSNFEKPAGSGKEQKNEAKKSSEEIRQLWIEKILEKGGFNLYSTLPEANSGFYNIADDRTTARAADMKSLSDIESDKEKVPECFKCEKLTEPEMVEKTHIVKGFFGGIKEKTVERVATGRQIDLKHLHAVKNGVNETCYEVLYAVGFGNNSCYDYKCMDGRPGNTLIIRMLLPEKFALEFEKYVKKDPAILRKLAEQVAVKKFNVSEEDWNTGNDQRRGHALRPPYEKWQTENNGKNRIYIKNINVNESQPSPGKRIEDIKRQNTIEF